MLFRSLSPLFHNQFDFFRINPHHSFSQIFGKTCDQCGVRVVGHSLYDGGSPFCRIAGFKNTRTDKDALRAKLHHQRCVCGCRDAPGGKIYDGEFPVFMDI